MALSPLGEITYMALAVNGCTSGAQAVQSKATPILGAVSQGNEVGGYVELVEALREAGAEVEADDSLLPRYKDSEPKIVVK